MGEFIRQSSALAAVMILAGGDVAGGTEAPPPGVGEAVPETFENEPEQTGRWDWLTSGSRWDARRRFISGGVVGTVDRIDRIFGDDRLDDDTQGSRLHVRGGAQYSRDDDFTLRSTVRLRLAMPRLQNRLQLILDDDIEAEDVESAEAVSDAVTDSKGDAALRFLFSENARHRLTFDAGVRGTDPIQGLGRVRGRLAFPLDKWELRLTETVAWLTADGFTETTEVRWTRPLKRAWWFRSTSRLTWEEERSGVAPGHAFTVGRTPGGRHAYRLDLSGAWPEVPHTQTARYAADFTYRYRLRPNWLFLDIVPGVDFRQEHDYHPNPGIALRLEVIFGEDP